RPGGAGARPVDRADVVARFHIAGGSALEDGVGAGDQTREVVGAVGCGRGVADRDAASVLESDADARKRRVAGVARAAGVLVHVDEARDGSAGLAEVVIDTPLPRSQAVAAQLPGSRPGGAGGGAVDGADVVAGFHIAGSRAFKD